MLKKFAAFFMLTVAILSVAGCKKDDEINSVMTDIHSVTDEIVKTIDAAPTADGVGAAQRIFDAKRKDLQAKWDGIKGARGFQVSKETQEKMQASYLKDFTAMKSLELKHMSVQNSEFKTRLAKLIKDWGDTFAIPKS
jgi:hypothetical protein